MSSFVREIASPRDSAEELLPTAHKALLGEAAIIRTSVGCGSHCTFCAIPKAAGRTRSRTIADVVSEIREVVSSGHAVVHLTSEDFSAYGLDTRVTFVELIEQALEITGLQRLSVDTLNPRWLAPQLDRFADVLTHHKFDRLLYVPVQSGSDRILKRMARGYGRREVDVILSRLALSKDVEVATDFIVGFPGETEDDFLETVRLAQEFPFRFVEVFAYSERSGTVAADFVESVPTEVRHERAERLISLSARKDLERRGIASQQDLTRFVDEGKRLSINTNVRFYRDLAEV